MFLLVTLLPVNTFASEQDSVGFTVESVKPNTQVDKSMTLYYFAVEPNKAQTLQLKIISQQKEKKSVKITVTDAVTNKNGNIDYGQETPTLDESLKNPVSSIVKVKDGMETVNVENFEEKIVELEVMPSSEVFEGVKLGAVRILAESDEKDKGTITNKYGYTIAMMLTEDRDDYKSGGDLRLKKISTGIEDGKKVVKVPLQNYKPKVMKDVDVSGYVTKKGDSKKITSKKIESVEFAPNSWLPFNVSLGLEALTPGTYTIHVKATKDEKDWSWEEDFEISESKANALNRQATFKLVLLPTIKLLAYFLIVAVVVITILLAVRHNKWKRELGEGE